MNRRAVREPLGAEADPVEVPFTVAEAQAGSATVFACPLCGARFTHGRLACASCPLNAGCEIVSCPACGYSFPRTSRLIEWARRWLGRSRRRP